MENSLFLALIEILERWLRVICVVVGKIGTFRWDRLGQNSTPLFLRGMFLNEDFSTQGKGENGTTGYCIREKCGVYLLNRFIFLHMVVLVEMEGAIDTSLLALRFFWWSHFLQIARVFPQRLRNLCVDSVSGG